MSDGSVLPVPWLSGETTFDVPALVTGLRRSSARGTRELATALAVARVRAELPGHEATDVERAVHCAQRLVEVAVEWRLPAVERWAVAWLRAIGRPYLRMRWSSRSHDGRLRQESRAPARVVGLAGGEGRIVLGTSNRKVWAWNAEDGLDPVGPVEYPAWAVAVAGDRVAAGGPYGVLATFGPAGTPPLRGGAALTALCLGPTGAIGVGAEDGTVRALRPTGAWVVHPVSGRGTVLAVAFHGDLLRVVWRDGQVAEIRPHDDGADWHDLADLGSPIRTATWNGTGQRLGYVRGSEVREWGVPTRAWRHPGAACLAWSPEGLLASGGADRSIMVGRPEADVPADRLVADAPVTALAFMGRRLLVSAHDADLVQWDLSRSGSDDPVFEPDDLITALAVGGQRVAAGSRLGGLTEFDGRGLVTHSWRQAVPGTVHQIVRHLDGWLVATQHGVYEWRPGQRRLDRHSERLCLAVASDGRRWAYGCGTYVHDGTGRQLDDYAGDIRDLRFGPDGRLVVVTDGGEVGLVGPGGAERLDPVLRGTRLLAAGPDGLLLLAPTGEPSLMPLPGVTGTGTRPAWLDGAPNGWGDWSSGPAVVLPDGRYVRAGADRRLVVSGDPPVSTPLRVAGLAAGPGRLVVADRTSVAAFDLVDPDGPGPVDPDPGPGTVRVHVEQTRSGWRVRLPDAAVAFSGGELADLRERVDSDSVSDLSEAIHLAGRLGDRLWTGGLARALDRARDRWPDRAVRLRWLLPDDAAELPWELLHPSTGPVCWFDEPPVTSVRILPRGVPAPAVPVGRPRLLVLRGVDELTHGGRRWDRLAYVDDAYDLLRRRTRATDVRLLRSRPGVVRTAADLPTGTAADVLHVWAHCASRTVDFAPGYAPEIAEVADRLAAVGPKLVVLVGCESAALARALVKAGVEAVVAMRSAVWSHTIQPLVEEITEQTLTGSPVDLAFAEALRRYVLTGQPGAPAVPLLHLAADSGGVLFPPRPEENR